MRNIAILLLCLATIAVLSSGSAFSAEPGMSNPHGKDSDCTLCHVASADTLNGWFVFPSTKRAMKGDLNAVCMKCHTVEPTHAGGFIGVGKGHATGKKTPINKRNLPLAADNTINCAITCHNMHIAGENKDQQRKYLRLPINDLCVSCHNM